MVEFYKYYIYNKLRIKKQNTNGINGKEVMIMRLQLKFDSGAGQIQIPQDFRRTFISLLKTLLQKTMWFSRYEMDRPGYVPFCT